MGEDKALGLGPRLRDFILAQFISLAPRFGALPMGDKALTGPDIHVLEGYRKVVYSQFHQKLTLKLTVKLRT